MDTEFLDRNVGDDNLIITDDVRSFLSQTAKWAKFIAIIGFIFIILMIILSFFVGSMMGSMGGDLGGGSMMGGTFITVIYILMALLYIMPIIYLYKFADKMKKALASNNQEVLNESFRNLKSHYKYIGILMCILIGFYLLAFILGGLGFLFS